MSKSDKTVNRQTGGPVNRRRIATLLGIIALVGALPVQAAGAVTIDATREGTDAVVTGTAEAVDSPIVRMGQDAAGDAAAAAGTALGADLRAFDIQTTASGDIVFRWVMESLPEPTSGAPGPVYGFSWIVDDEQGYELDVARAKVSPTGPSEPGAVLWSCAGTDCTPAEQTSTSAVVPVTFDAASKTITATVKAADIGVTPGSRLDETAVALGSVFVGAGALPSPFLYNTFDFLSLEDGYVVPSLDVSLGTAAPDADPGAVTFDTPAEVDGSAFSGRIATASGDAVFARACTSSGKATAVERVCTTGSTPALP